MYSFKERYMKVQHLSKLHSIPQLLTNQTKRKIKLNNVAQTRLLVELQRVRLWSGKSEVQIPGRSIWTQCCQWLATASTFLRKELCFPGAMTQRWTTPSRYSLQRITAIIMKDLIGLNVAQIIRVGAFNRGTEKNRAVYSFQRPPPIHYWQACLKFIGRSICLFIKIMSYSSQKLNKAEVNLRSMTPCRSVQFFKAYCSYVTIGYR